MRSVTIFVENKSIIEIEKQLDIITKYKQRNPWCMFFQNPNDPVLYINIDYDNSLRNSLEIIELIENNSELSNVYEIIQVDISGRYNGYEELIEFLKELFKDISGYVVDDYTDHFWNIKEIIENRKIYSHGFFDTDGWYEEEQRNI